MPRYYEIFFTYNDDPVIKAEVNTWEDPQTLKEKIKEMKKTSDVPVQGESFEKFAARTDQPVRVRSRKWKYRKTKVSKKEIERAGAILRRLDKQYGPLQPIYPAAPRLARGAPPGMYHGDSAHRDASGETVFPPRSGPK